MFVPHVGINVVCVQTNKDTVGTIQTEIISHIIYPGKLECTSNADQLKFNGRLAQIYLNLIGQAIVSFVRRKQVNFCDLQKLLPS